MPTITKHLIAKRGAVYRFTVYLVAVDVTAYTARLQIRVNNVTPSAGALALALSVGSGITLTGSTTIPAPDGRVAGKIAIVITAVQMTTLTDDVYNWGLETTDGNGEIEEVFEGRFGVTDKTVHS